MLYFEINILCSFNLALRARSEIHKRLYANGVGLRPDGTGSCRNLVAFVGITITVSYSGTYIKVDKAPIAANPGTTSIG